MTMPRPTDRKDAEKHPLLSLYDSAADLEIHLEPSLRNPSFALTAANIGSYNAILKAAREALPDSVALREDADEADVTARPADLYHALHTTIVPTLHNALPPDAYERRG